MWKRIIMRKINCIVVKILKQKRSPNVAVLYAKVNKLFVNCVVTTKTMYNLIELDFLKVKNINLAQNITKNLK